MLGLSLAACGKQDTDDGVKQIYNSMNDTTEAVGESTQSGLKAAAEENGKSVKKSSDVYKRQCLSFTCRYSSTPSVTMTRKSPL